MIIVILYGKESIFKTRQEAIYNLSDYVLNSEGAEMERYAYALARLCSSNDKYIEEREVW